MLDVGCSSIRNHWDKSNGIEEEIMLKMHKCERVCLWGSRFVGFGFWKGHPHVLEGPNTWHPPKGAGSGRADLRVQAT